MWAEAAEAATAEVQECLYGVRGDNDELWHGVLDGCQDDATWSSAGENCEVYVDSEYCIDGGYGPGWHQDWGTFKDWTDGNGVDASTACCACGGGARLWHQTCPSATDMCVTAVFDDVDDDEDSFWIYSCSSDAAELELLLGITVDCPSSTSGSIDFEGLSLEWHAECCEGQRCNDDYGRKHLSQSYNGVAPHAKIIFEDASPDDPGDPYLYMPDSAEDLFSFAYSKGARIHSDSWGSSSVDYGSIEAELDEYLADHDDYLILVAAGNDGPYEMSVGSPAHAKNVLAVGATMNHPSVYNGGIFPDGYQNPGQLWMSITLGVAEGPDLEEYTGTYTFEIVPAEFGPAMPDSLNPIQAPLARVHADGCSANSGDSNYLFGKIAFISVEGGELRMLSEHNISRMIASSAARRMHCQHMPINIIFR